jgi:hypothetical protein
MEREALVYDWRYGAVGDGHIGGGHAGLTMLIISINLGEHLIPLRAELVNVGVGTGSEDFSGSRR